MFTSADVTCHVVSSTSISAALYVLFHASVWQVMASKMSSSSVPMVLRVKRKRIEKPADSLGGTYLE